MNGVVRPGQAEVCASSQKRCVPLPALAPPAPPPPPLVVTYGPYGPLYGWDGLRRVLYPNDTPDVCRVARW